MEVAGIEDTIAGVWALYRNENLDGYLKECGVNFILRKLAQAASLYVTMVISMEDGQLRIQNKGPKNTDHKAPLGTEIFITDLMHNPMKEVHTWDKNQLVTVSEPTPGSKALPTRVIRELVEGQLVMTLIVNDVVCKMFYKRKS
ncbi:fatty acid-binding protein, heart-like [Crassostrea angulata]|uniref:Lipocalin/cytosolic fatty-acid binding domain-containing protein n=3 Tax=Magallana gigas TaxID=29159 RepID=A0A8W8KHY5_MAGGI|nr:fatty acid-binding protein, heart isoform X2 [Crassostrea gigas]XP_052718087.1 fatty acid-binding protein, heart-like [Crassostrea angulata]